jgi:hypothetical protein
MVESKTEERKHFFFFGITNLLFILQMELSKSLGVHEKLSLDLLVSLAFIDDDEPQNQLGRFDDTASKYTPDEYIAKAKKVLAKRPELSQVGSLLEKVNEG